MSKNRLKQKVYVNLIDYGQVYGDKIVLHKSDIEKAIRRIKSNPDPFEEPDRRHGRLDILDDLVYAINKGMESIREKESRKK